MQTLAEIISAHLPEGWSLENLINLDPGWQANISDGTYVVVATGNTMEGAILHAKAKAYAGKYKGTRIEVESLAHLRLPDQPKVDLSKALGLGPKIPVINRRI